MIQDTQNRKKRPYKAVLLLLCAFILALTPLLMKTTFASNSYISNILFYTDGEGYNRVKFFVNTTFTENWGAIGYPVANSCTLLSQNGASAAPSAGSSYNPGKTLRPLNYSEINTSNCQDITYTAGYTYDTYLFCERDAASYFVMNENKANLKAFCDKTAFTSNSYLLFNTPIGNYNQFLFTDTEKYYYSEFPTLTITYPLDEAEIATAFYITGSYTLPDASTFDKLMAYFGYDISGETRFYEFYQDVSVPSGSVNIRVAGLPARSYFVGYSFINTSDPDDYYMVLKWYHIHIVVSIPPELPDGETPPIVFDILDPASYYTANSSYASSTLLFDNLSGALKPIILTIGNNLTFFSSKFEQSKAQETGETMASGVLVVRTYANNLNSFFSDLPIAQALFLYLLLLVVVAVFRIIKNLINLIKP